MTGRRIHELPSPVLFHGLELQLHHLAPCWIALCLRVRGRLANVRQMQLCAHPRLHLRHGFVAEDVVDPAAPEGLAAVERVKAIFIILQRSG